jgi:hypothetical protein
VDEKRRRDEPHRRPSTAEMDERVVIALDPETAIEALVKVNPDSHEAKRQRARDRAGDVAPPKLGRGRK